MLSARKNPRESDLFHPPSSIIYPRWLRRSRGGSVPKAVRAGRDKEPKEGPSYEDRSLKSTHGRPNPRRHAQDNDALAFMQYPPNRSMAKQAGDAAERRSLNRMTRSVWNARSLPPLSSDPCLATAPASWTHSKRFAVQFTRISVEADRPILDAEPSTFRTRRRQSKPRRGRSDPRNPRNRPRRGGKKTRKDARALETES